MYTIIDSRSIEDIIKAKEANGRLVPACGGTEKPFTCKGYRLLYCWDMGTNKHVYLNLGTDMVLSDDEVYNIFLK